MTGGRKGAFASFVSGVFSFSFLDCIKGAHEPRQMTIDGCAWTANETCVLPLYGRLAGRKLPISTMDMQ